MTDPAVEAAQRAWEATASPGPNGWTLNPYAVSKAAAREALAPIRALHKMIPPNPDYRTDVACCSHCLDTSGASPAPWPCDTARLAYPSEEL